MSSMKAPLADPDILAARRTLLDRPGMASLRAFAAGIRASHGPTPDFDPADGGPAARLLLLLETPGTAIGKTGFVSADNATGTAANLRRFFAAAGIARQDVAIWNAVPFVIHTGGPNRAPRRGEVRRGLELLPPLLPLLPELRCVIMSGRVAGLAGPMLAATMPSLSLIHVPHPSPVYVCTSPDIPRRIIAGFEAATALLVDEKTCAMHNSTCVGTGHALP